MVYNSASVDAVHDHILKRLLEKVNENSSISHRNVSQNRVTTNRAALARWVASRRGRRWNNVVASEAGKHINARNFDHEACQVSNAVCPATCFAEMREDAYRYCQVYHISSHCSLWCLKYCAAGLSPKPQTLTQI
eukprot:IDg10172t1